MAAGAGRRGCRPRRGPAPRRPGIPTRPAAWRGASRGSLDAGSHMYPDPEVRRRVGPLPVASAAKWDLLLRAIGLGGQRRTSGSKNWDRFPAGSSTIGGDGTRRPAPTTGTRSVPPGGRPDDRLGTGRPGGSAAGGRHPAGRACARDGAGENAGRARRALRPLLRRPPRPARSGWRPPASSAALGHEVALPEGQTCCGQPALNAGYFDEARRLARRCSRPSPTPSPDAVVAPSGSCVAALRVEGRDAPRPRHPLLERLYELSEFLTDVLGLTDVGATFPGRVAWHDACHPLRELGIRDGPRRLLAAVRGLDLVEPRATAEECCGFGGTFAVKVPGVSSGDGPAQGPRRDGHRARPSSPPPSPPASSRSEGLLRGSGSPVAHRPPRGDPRRRGGRARR